MADATGNNKLEFTVAKDDNYPKLTTESRPELDWMAHYGGRDASNRATKAADKHLVSSS